MSDWSARVEWVADRGLTGDQADRMTADLRYNAGSVGNEVHGNPSAQLTVQATTVREAFDAAALAVETACRASGIPCTITAVEVVTWEEFQRRQAEPVVPPLVGFAEIAQILGKDDKPISRQRAREIALAQFDEVARTSNGPLYLRAHVEEFARTWERKRTGRPPRTAPQ